MTLLISWSVHELVAPLSVVEMVSGFAARQAVLSEVLFHFQMTHSTLIGSKAVVHQIQRMALYRELEKKTLAVSV